MEQSALDWTWAGLGPGIELGLEMGLERMGLDLDLGIIRYYIGDWTALWTGDGKNFTPLEQAHVNTKFHSPLGSEIGGPKRGPQSSLFCNDRGHGKLDS